jgi:hypothetical protein
MAPLMADPDDGDHSVLQDGSYCDIQSFQEQYVSQEWRLSPRLLQS